MVALECRADSVDILQNLRHFLCMVDVQKLLPSIPSRLHRQSFTCLSKLPEKRRRRGLEFLPAPAAASSYRRAPLGIRPQCGRKSGRRQRQRPTAGCAAQWLNPRPGASRNRPAASTPGIAFLGLGNGPPRSE